MQHLFPHYEATAKLIDRLGQAGGVEDTGDISDRQRKRLWFHTGFDSA